MSRRKQHIIIFAATRQISWPCACKHLYTIRNAQHLSGLVSQITTDNPVATGWLSKYTNFFLSKGASSLTAHKQALQSMANIVVKRSTQLSFVDAFHIVGSKFLRRQPMLLLAGMKKKEKSQVILADH